MQAAAEAFCLLAGFAPRLAAAAATFADAAIVLKPSSSHENYVFMCDAEKSIPKSENLIIL